MMKKALTILMTIILLFSMFGSVSAATGKVSTFKVDGKLFVTPTGEPQPYINKDNRTMGSLRLIAAALGVENKHIQWDQTKQTATLARGSNKVSVTVGKKVITVNGKSVTMDTVAEMKQGRVFIPARFIAQGLGVGISFDGLSNTVNFLTGAKVVNNNFADYGLKQMVDLPVTLAANGLEITYHEAFLYKTDSAEALALHKKYDFVDYNSANHILWLKVTITNKSSKEIATDYRDLQLKIGGANAFSEAMYQGFSSEKDFLYTWALQPNESISGYVVLMKYNTAPIDFISFKTMHKTYVTSHRIAEKVN